jgi:sensor histidine kinase YesM
VQVEDNGPGLKINTNGGSSGIGLNNTRSRLEQFYGPDYDFQIRNSKGSGVIVTLEIPANPTINS